MINIRIRYRALLGALLALLGFQTACEEMRVEYGAPHADYVVEGNVQNDSGLNLEKIQVIMNYDTTFTNSAGDYQLKSSVYGEDTILLQFKSIEGISPGEYSSLDTLVGFNDVEYTGGDDNWYMGTKEKIVNVKLKEKE